MKTEKRMMFTGANFLALRKFSEDSSQIYGHCKARGEIYLATTRGKEILSVGQYLYKSPKGLLYLKAGDHT